MIYHVVQYTCREDVEQLIGKSEVALCYAEETTNIFLLLYFRVSSLLSVTPMLYLIQSL